MSAPLNEMLLQPSPLGEVFVSARDVAGATSYTTGGTKISANGWALLTFKMLLSSHLSQDGLYFARFIMPKGPGFPTAFMVWYTAAAAGGSVAFTTITAGGTYTGTTPTVTFTAAPAGGTTATGVAILNGAGTAVIGILLTNPGAGYLAAPTPTFSAGGATATSTLTASTAESQVANGTNLSASSIRVLALGN